MNKSVKSLLTLFFLSIFTVIVFFTMSGYEKDCDTNLVFHDEFNGSSLDKTKWSTEYPSGNGGEQQYYGPNAFEVADGVLSINAVKEASHGYPYTSGIITTQNTFAQQYGYFVMRAKLPYGQGFWPAFWLLPVSKNYPVEIDVFELLGHEPKTIHMTNHWRGPDGSHQTTSLVYTGETDFTAGYHTYAIEWTPTEIDWYIDGELQAQTDQAVPSEPLFLLANLAVGGKWPGNPDLTTHFPGVMQIDYIRIYSLGCYPENAMK